MNPYMPPEQEPEPSNNFNLIDFIIEFIWFIVFFLLMLYGGISLIDDTKEYWMPYIEEFGKCL